MDIRQALIDCNTRGKLFGGITVSRQEAKFDLWRAIALREEFKSACLHHALLMGIASRESRIGYSLDDYGLGDYGAAYGLMQVDTRYHRAEKSGGPLGIAHIKQACGILRDFYEVVKANHPSWNEANLLKGMLVAYNSGPGNVRTIESMDAGTTGNDYGSDVIARAKFYLEFVQ